MHSSVSLRVLVVAALTFVACGSSPGGSDSGVGGGTGGGTGGGSTSMGSTTFTGGLVGTVAKNTTVTGQTLGASSSLLIRLSDAFSTGGSAISVSSDVLIDGALTATTYTASNTKLQSSTVRRDGVQWSQTYSTSETKGSLTITLTSLGTPDVNGTTTNYNGLKGSYTMVLKSDASDPDVTVTGSF